MELTQRYLSARLTAIIGAVVNLILGVTKIFFGIVGHSGALVADGVHSFSDLLTDGLVLVASRYGSQEADKEHPYGHARIETAATLFLSMILMLAGGGILYDAIYHLWLNVHVTPSFFVLLVTLLVIAVKEILYQYTKTVGEKIQSKLLIANAWHHRSDALSSVVVFIGVAGSLMGYTRLDAVAALFVAVMVMKMAWQLAWSSVRELVDTGVDETTLNKIKQVIQDVPGVIELHQLRNRVTGGNILLDVHLLVAPKLSVSEGHHIGEQVRRELQRQFLSIIDITVHIDPEDDEICAPSEHLPSRYTVIQQLSDCFESLPGAKEVKSTQLHYLSGQLQVEITLPLELLQTHEPDFIQQQYQQSVVGIDSIEMITVVYTA